MCLSTLLAFTRDQGSIIAGLLALGAAFWTVRTTRRTADRTINAMRETADREIAAAQEQTAVGQRQIGETLRLEKRRIAREEWAFRVALQAAMAAVLHDVDAAREGYAKVQQGIPSLPLYDVRQSIRKTAFTELRAASLRLGGELANLLFQLDNAIDGFASRWQLGNVLGRTDLQRLGRDEGLAKELDQIEARAMHLQREAGAGRERCLRELDSTEQSED